jgi:glycosyltransferase involved in cell wall biosynthesis
MICLAYISFTFAVIQLLVAITNFLFRQSLPSNNSISGGRVSVLIPARNEEKNIVGILHDLQQQDYPDIEIIVFDDFSDDKTAEIVAGESVTDNRIRLVKSDGLPDGWLGKNHACHTLSKFASGDYLLFADADVRLKDDIITKAVTLSEKFNLGLLSIFPVQTMITTGERITVPNMHFILLSLLPLILVRKSGYRSLAAANGQFMLFNSGIYHQLTPHKKVRGNKVEDIEIARYFKQHHIRIACITGIAKVKCRMYGGFREAVNGFSRNVFSFFGNSFLLAFLFWIFTTLGLAFVVLSMDLNLILIYIAILVITRILISYISKQNILLNIIFFIPQQLALGFIIYRALVSRYKNQYLWKGRNIS